MNRDEIKASHPIVEFMKTQTKVVRVGTNWMALCPFHGDKNPSMSLDEKENVFHCHGCGANGSVIDFVMRRDNLSIANAMEKLGGKKESELIEVAAYSYQDENGHELFQAVRYIPKTFKQRHKENGGWVWNMQGVRRVLYRLPEVLKSNDVIVCEGEKDVDNLAALGFTATCNVGGAKKWMDSYSECLKDKNVVVIPDNDPPGKEHADIVCKSLTGKASKIFRIEIPAPDKDASDLIARHKDKAKEELLSLMSKANLWRPECSVPIKSMAEMETEYLEFVRKSKERVLNLGNFLDGFKLSVRPLVPGELVVVLADTGVGKTAILQNIAVRSPDTKILFFELELPGPLMFERFIQIETKYTGNEVFQEYEQGRSIKWENASLQHIYTCSLSRMNPMEMERIINESELKIGAKPAVVMVDYVGLLQGKGSSRYERISEIAEQLKIIAKSTNTVIVMASQIHRKGGDANEISLHDAKDSGSIENSSGLVLGCWRIEREKLCIKILKNTKGISGKIIHCKFDGEHMRITEDKELPINNEINS